MDICILAPENSPSWGGVGSYTYNLIKHLPKSNNINVLTIGRDVSCTYKELFNDYDNVQVDEIVAINPNDVFFYNFKFQLAVFKYLKKYCATYKFDVIHSHSGHLPHLFSQFQKLSPLVVTVHATVRGMKRGIKQSNVKVDPTEFYMNFFSKGIEFCEKISFNKADYLLPVSQFTLNQIHDDYHVNTEGKTKVVYTAVDTVSFSPNLESQINDKPVILFAGRFYSLKGFDIFLNSIEIIVKEGYKIKVRLAGRGNNEYVLEYLSKIMDREDYSIEGMVNYSEMPKLFESCDILVVPSLYENCPLTILEAMSCGKIVIASNVGGIPEIIQDKYNGFLFEKGNSLDLSRIIISILEGNVNIDSIQRNARNSILKYFDWKIRGEDLFNLYRKMV